MNRKQVLPKPQRSLRSEFAYQPFPKAKEKPSVATWASPGKSMKGSVTGGTYRAFSIEHQFGTR